MLTEMQQKIIDYRNRQAVFDSKIVELARPLIPVLRDHQLHACAQPLIDAYATRDAAEQDLLDVAVADPKAFAEALVSLIKGPR